MINNDDRPPLKITTIISDLDGTLISHKSHGMNQHNEIVELLPGVLEKFKEWERKEYHIILMTGRRESTRIKTEEQLRNLGLVWDTLIMNCGSGIRVLLNDTKPNTDEDTAIAITVKRNEGLEGIKI